MLKETQSKLLSLGRDTVRRGGISARALWNNASGKCRLPQPLLPYTLRVKAVSPDHTHTRTHNGFRLTRVKMVPTSPLYLEERQLILLYVTNVT